MRIPCPYCGERDHHEFIYHGASLGPRPEAEADTFAYVYLRKNPAGAHTELWFHSGGCRSWLEVSRDTRTHAIDSARRADAGEAP